MRAHIGENLEALSEIDRNHLMMSAGSMPNDPFTRHMENQDQLDNQDRIGVQS
jgi:hypothetical protein